MTTEWTNEQVAAQYRLDVRHTFEAENAEWRAWEAEQIIEIRAKPSYAERIARDPNYADVIAVRDSFLWEIYSRSTINIVSNRVTVILPTGFGLHSDLIEMFGGASVCWCKPGIDATIIDGEARVTVELILIDYWDDDRAAKWANAQAQKPPRTYWPIDSTRQP